ncbi:hypothetical protein BD626DRAFT_182961 [Schizophyllum amplum]|uniref:Uncharacterized protein n=1 Tax=Schizophyllum amplum TaxID=97359 RepID=A0A550C0Z5_9AGAR|nr:hypothetical protein BD626DRAFT_182961 [Auriculariopsis ampla]
MSLPTLPRPHRLSLSMGEHRAERPRPPDLRLESHSMLYRLEGDGSSRQVQDVSPRGLHDESRRRLQHDTPRRLHAHSLSAGAVSPGLTPRFPPPGSSGRNLDGLASHDVAPISRRSREGSYDGSSCSSEGIGMYASQDGSGTSSYPNSLRSPLESPSHTGLTYPDDVGAYMDKSGAYIEGGNAYSEERTAYTHIGGTDLEGGAYTHISNDGGAYTDHAMAYAGWDALPAPQPHSAETFAFAGEQQGWEHGKMEQHETLDGAHGGIQSGFHNDGGMSLDGGVQHDPMHGGHGDMMHGGPDAIHADALRHDAQFAPGDMAFGGGMSAVGHLGATHPGAAGGQL